ncbi:MAG: efflux RND transporter periplasmic adaptor subunit [Thermoanaerobaculia bacterium]
MVPPEETAVVKQAAANLKQASLTRDRMARLLQEQLIPQQDFDAAEAAYGVADARYQEAIEEARTRQALLSQRRSELAIAQRQLLDSVVTAPFDGMIRERLVSTGDYAAVGSPVAVLVRVHPLRLRLAVPSAKPRGSTPASPSASPWKGIRRPTRAGSPVSARRSARRTGPCSWKPRLPTRTAA